MQLSIAHIALVVRDYEEALAFYVGVLGFRLIEDLDQPEQDKRWITVAPPGAPGASLLLARASTPEQQAFIGNQTGGRVFLFLRTDDFWRDFRRLTAAGVRFVRAPSENPTARSRCSRTSMAIAGTCCNTTLPVHMHPRDGVPAFAAPDLPPTRVDHDGHPRVRSPAMKLSLVIQIVTLVALLAGLLFGAFELRRARQERNDKGALDVLGIAVRPDHIAASYAILDLDGDSTSSVIANSPTLREHANILMVLYEYIGNLVYQRMVPLRTVDLLMGGIIRATWQRMRSYIEDQRAATGLVNIAEWFQWLVERLQDHELPGQERGAHVILRDWKP